MTIFMRVLCPGRIGIWSVGFCGRRKKEEPGEKPSVQCEHQQKTELYLVSDLYRVVREKEQLQS